VTIVTYHAVDPLWTGALSVHPAAFEEQIAWLVSHRRVVALAELLDRFPDGVSSDLVALTFDDGFSSVVQYALPVLARSEVPFTVFLIAKMYDGSTSSVDWVDRPPGHPLRTLDPSEIRRLRANGASFGSHSYLHADMTTLGYDAAVADLIRSRDTLQHLLGEDVTSLAYPRGRHDDDVRRAAAAAGFTSAFGLAVAPEMRGPHALPRVGIYPTDTGWSLRLKTAPFYGRLRASPRYHPLRRRFQRH
jgi:peptidoglycan/xylan/chitin deacetylase (PgdA/CDA1 family)